MQKEAYFTQDTIRTKSQELLDSVADLRQRHADMLFRPEAAALLVLDMQDYFLEAGSHAYVPSAPVIVTGIARLLAAFTRFTRPVIFTRHGNTPENAGMLGKWWRDLIKPQDAYSHLSAKLNTAKALIINKNQYDAFHDTVLEDALRKLGTEQVVICGVMTHLCCETTARSAFMRGFEVYFTVDGTATYYEALHRASLLTLSHGFALPVLVEELITRMEADAT